MVQFCFCAYIYINTKNIFPGQHEFYFIPSQDELNVNINQNISCKVDDGDSHDHDDSNEYKQNDDGIVHSADSNVGADTGNLNDNADAVDSVVDSDEGITEDDGVPAIAMMTMKTLLMAFMRTAIPRLSAIV